MDVRLYQGESEYWMDNGLPDNISVISDEQKEQIRSLEGVESATFYNRRGMRTESPIATPVWTVEVCTVWMRSF